LWLVLIMEDEEGRLISSEEICLLSEALEKNQKYQMELISLFTHVDKLLRRNRSLQRQAKFKPTIFEEIEASQACPYFIDANGSVPEPNPDAVKRDEEWNPKNSKKWTERETNDLKKGVLQQFQSAALQSFYNAAAEEDYPLWRVEEEANTLREMKLEDVDESDWSPNWEEIAHIWVRTRSAADCEMKWRNDFSVLYNRGEWGKDEDKLLFNLVNQHKKKQLGLHFLSNDFSFSSPVFHSIPKKFKPNFSEERMD